MQTKPIERRRHPRISTLNAVTYLLYDRKGKMVSKGRGHTINLSQDGVMLETRTAIDGVFIVLMAIDLNGRELTIKGRVAHTRGDSASGRFLSGIKFTDPQDKQREVIVAFVKAYHHRKHLAMETANSLRSQKNNRLALVKSGVLIDGGRMAIHKGPECTIQI
jgi:hypothetical protein